jgi:23S rRNA (cytidine1920-2'-O)/16S rRNA (cytidine1409-2'-O)-methyltransferase
MKDRRRLDVILVERGLVESREKGQALIIAGQVLVNGQKVEKPGQAVASDSQIKLAEQPRYVGRGGVKLEAALDHFAISVKGKVCLDVGSSTGGFTDCLLQRGATRVYAIDVGTGQLDWKLRNDSRVVVHEQVNARYLTSEEVPEKVDLAVCDVSFISATMILPVLTNFLANGAEMVILVKPQFELERHQVGRGGIIRDPALHQHACRRVEDAVRQLGFQTQIISSPVLGAEGNQEFLLYARH